jgi:hypothetical protein
MEDAALPENLLYASGEDDPPPHLLVSPTKPAELRREGTVSRM